MRPSPPSRAATQSQRCHPVTALPPTQSQRAQVRQPGRFRVLDAAARGGNVRGCAFGALRQRVRDTALPSLYFCNIWSGTTIMPASCVRISTAGARHASCSALIGFCPHVACLFVTLRFGSGGFCLWGCIGGRQFLNSDGRNIYCMPQSSWDKGCVDHTKLKSPK